MDKYKIIVVFLFLLTVFSINEVSALVNYNGIFVDKVIYLDAGHGGPDPGAVHKNLKESDINLSFCKILGNRLEQLGATVLYIREGDYDLSSTKNGRKRSDLSNRIKAINDAKPDIYISVHVNSDPNPTWYGAQVFYNNKNEKNIILAEKIGNSLKKANVSKRKISKINNIYMYDRINYPGILLEVGFISNYGDRKDMQSQKYIENFSNVVISGIANFFKNI